MSAPVRQTHTVMLITGSPEKKWNKNGFIIMRIGIRILSGLAWMMSSLPRAINLNESIFIRKRAEDRNPHANGISHANGIVPGRSHVEISA